VGHRICGGRLLIKDRAGDEAKRKVIFIAKDLDPEITSVIGDPATEGGRGVEGLQVVNDPQRWKMLAAGSKSCPDL